MKGRKGYKALGLPKPPNVQRRKNRDVYLFDKSDYIPAGTAKLTLRARRKAKEG